MTGSPALGLSPRRSSLSQCLGCVASESRTVCTTWPASSATSMTVILAEVRHLAQEFPRHPLGFRQGSRKTWEFHTLWIDLKLIPGPDVKVVERHGCDRPAEVHGIRMEPSAHGPTASAPSD